jgi:hypothetical protein
VDLPIKSNVGINSVGSDEGRNSTNAGLQACTAQVSRRKPDADDDVYETDYVSLFC